MKYLKEFENHAAYEAAESGLILPNVSLCVQENEVYYKPDIYNGHEYVDLGLPSKTLWATMNIGASSPTDYGNYYQYGKGADDYSVTSGDSNYSGTEDPLAASADTAVQVWGGSWHMPTSAQCQELIDECTWSWGTNGYTVSKNGKSMFLPAAGYWNNGSQNNVGSSGSYWSSTPTGSSGVYYMNFNDSGDKSVLGNDLRGFGFSVRPVVG